MDMRTAYELWRVVMYGVGVFVTCNVGGLTLYAAFRRARRKVRRTDGRGHVRQSWADLRRQIEWGCLKSGRYWEKVIFPAR